MFKKNKFKKIAKFLKLDKPLVIFHLETTGDSVSSDKIIELAYVKIMPNGRAIVGSFLLNPEIKISDEAVAFHGISNKDVAGMPTFRQKAREIKDIFSNCYLGGYNIINFYLPFLRREFIRVGIDFDYTEQDIIDARIIYNYMEPRTLSTSYNYYCGKEHLNVNTALGDVEVISDILASQLKKYNVVRDLHFIKEMNRHKSQEELDDARKFYWRNGEAHFNFSKYQDRPISEVVKEDQKFLEWILSANFSEGSKSIVRSALEKSKQ